MKSTLNSLFLSASYFPLPIIELGVKSKCCKKYKKKGKHCKRCPRTVALQSKLDTKTPIKY